ncbi:glycosyltransferase family 2 protein [Rhodothermus bifroesti]|uniref:glycosyltransferase family 2 protein n=1 Tax=Rhodothermus bifroesti TaxID=2823335 RepID=UPI001AF028CA|nr:glycosyltransferase family 2 protein [Rhodothermus bifroesti]
MALISVLTPSLNYGRFLEDAILSVRFQEGVDVEHVVQDGGSTDGTQELLKRYSWVQWDSSPDKGQSDALNKALRRARGDWIAWLNADEFFLPGALSHLLSQAIASGADVVYGDCLFVDEKGQFLRLRTAHTFSQFVLWHYGPFIPSCAVLIRRELLGIDPWHVDVDRVMDWQLYLDLALKKAKFVWTPCPIGVFRVHAAQITAQDWRRFARSYRLLTERYRARPSRLHFEYGRLWHRILKLKDGCYLSEFRALNFRGRSFRWFKGEQQASNFLEFLRACYGSEKEA